MTRPTGDKLIDELADILEEVSATVPEAQAKDERAARDAASYPVSQDPGLALPPAEHAASLDPRRNAFRPDLAAVTLRGKVAASRFVPGVARQVIRAAVPLRKRPDPTLGLETEALFGERVTVYEEAEGWAWVQLSRDRYVGYVPADALTHQTWEPTHRVKALGTFVYPVPDMKAQPLQHLSVTSEVAIVETGERMSRLSTGGYVVTRHLVEKDRYERDPVDIAERLLGTPYLWGGRTRIGIDCSGLVQMSLTAAGIPCPRDSDMQAADVGDGIEIPSNLEGLERGDLVFWKGHVGIMADGLMLVHANAHHMAVVVETLPEAAERIMKQTGSAITAIRRLAKPVSAST